jgi:negative regulator of sigma E activity
MKPESHAWNALNDRAISLLRPGFTERTLRAARAVAPTFFSQCILSAVTASVCLLVVFLVHSRITANETARNLAGWEQLAAESEQLGQIP